MISASHCPKKGDTALPPAPKCSCVAHAKAQCCRLHRCISPGKINIFENALPAAEAGKYIEENILKEPVLLE